jgi:hypothetical protein
MKMGPSSGGPIISDWDRQNICGVYVTENITVRMNSVRVIDPERYGRVN